MAKSGLRKKPKKSMKVDPSKSMLEQIVVSEDASIALITRALGIHMGPSVGTGLALVVGSTGRLEGIITDSDLRRGIAAHGLEKALVARDLMRKDFSFVLEDADPLAEMSRTYGELWEERFTTMNPVKVLPVVDRLGKPVGVIESSVRERDASVSRDVTVIVGQGYVGATLAAAFSDAGFRTYGVDASELVIDGLRRGHSHTREPGLDSSLRSGLESGRLSFHNSVEDLPEIGFGRRRHFVLTVGTPVNSDGADLDALHSAVDLMGKILRKGDLVALRSTVPLGTTRRVGKRLEAISQLREGIDFFVVSAPERTVEGAALMEIRALPQIVGGTTPLGTQIGADFFRNISSTVVEVDSAEFAEMVKLGSNSFRDYLFAFSNYLAQVCAQFDLDVNEVIRVSNLGYSRNSIADPSPGVGGPCLTKDPYMMPGPLKRESGETQNLIRTSRIFNESFLQFQIGRIVDEIDPQTKPSIAALGVTFKGSPPTNDLRGSTGLQIATSLGDEGADVYSWDAVLGDGAGSFPGISARDNYRAILILNNHPSNEEMALDLIAKSASPEVVIYDPWRLLGNSLNEIRGNPNKFYLYMTLSNKVAL